MTNHPNRQKITNWPEYLKAFRARHGITQQQLADILKIAVRTIEGWEQEEFTPPPYLRIALTGPSVALRCREIRDVSGVGNKP